MLILLSPAKKLDFSPAPIELSATKPRLTADIAALAKVTKKLKRNQIVKLMHLSDNLAELNYQRFQAFDPALDGPDVLQGVLAFNGDVYQGLRARDLSCNDLAWAQEHVRILSGLYGILRPLDVIAPYRLEMGTRLKTRRGESLYAFWGDRLAKALNGDLKEQSNPIVLNLASTEYFSAIATKALKARVITGVFKEIKHGQARTLSFYAKHARGAMARFCIENRIDDPEAIKAFNIDGYRFDAAASKMDTWVFSRPQPPGKIG
ncbi:peroxide stress protein YaaA [Candidatus Phycosocius spiralis]|uniref:UPF0246 protein PsB1_1508 n=1 Tax=Candidatus Phycosocius spiralis TaxID=2815099 RepID=A0ABQ4PWL3_9PROT|nr:peroxide stress protein YaaA [Candidatus Phycosocius spiralis]GIU67354.1 UPF0246 protein [Candidatus Phycosocius spiralis]